MTPARGRFRGPGAERRSALRGRVALVDHTRSRKPTRPTRRTARRWWISTPTAARAGTACWNFASTRRRASPRDARSRPRRCCTTIRCSSAFAGLPSKENGVDIEGLAAKDGALYLGFRGPVLRENFVPIARVDPSGSDEPELLFVKLGGRGVRDIAATTDGFLILAGPNGDQDWSFELFHWDGRDMVTGSTGRRAAPCGICAPFRLIPTAIPRASRSCRARRRRRT